MSSKEQLVLPYKKCYAEKGRGNNYTIHLWDDGGKQELEWRNYAYKESDYGEYEGFRGEKLEKVYKWDYDDKTIHYHDMQPAQKFLIETYGTNDEPSTSHKELFFDIEIEIGGRLTQEYIRQAPMPCTSIAWYDKFRDKWGILILDKQGKMQYSEKGNKEIIPVRTEKELLAKWVERIREIDPDILIGYNSDHFDIPYLYFRICNVLGEEWAMAMSPINIARDISQWSRERTIEFAGLETLDYLRLHKQFSMREEPSYKLDAIGEKYAGLGKIEYEGSLNRLFEDDIDKFIEYNFRDVEILKVLDEKLGYLDLTKNLCHKGKINYHQVHSTSVVHDGAISAYLLSKGIIPPRKERNNKLDRKIAGGYVFCPTSGLYNYIFDLDLTSLYPSIMMTLNMGKETMIGKIYHGDEKNNRLGLKDLKEMPQELNVRVQNHRGQTKMMEVSKLVKFIEDMDIAVAANGVMFSKDKPSVFSILLNEWFNERVRYKNLMKKYKSEGNKAMTAKYHTMQYTIKILLNSLFGATAMNGFRYGNILIGEAITLSGQRIIQESALHINHTCHNLLSGNIDKEVFTN